MALALLATSCAKPKPPFDQMSAANVTAFRLQNYDPPAQTTTVPTGGAAAIPGLPQQLQDLLNQGAPVLESVIPPGLLPPGLIPGLSPAPASPTPTVGAQEPRFPETAPNYRILSQTQVIDPKLKKELGRIFGNSKGFSNEHQNCMYPELGIRFVIPPQPANDLLVSFLCNQVQPRGFMWPHPAAGMKSETGKDLRAVVNKIFPPGT
jgi:hypothetical protein